MAIEYILVEKHSRPGKNGVTMWRFTFYRMDNGLLYETTVDNTYDNFKRNGWDHLVVDDNPWGIYTGLKTTSRTTKDGLPVVSADSYPVIQTRCRSREEALHIVELDQQQRNPQYNEFNNLFGK